MKVLLILPPLEVAKEMEELIRVLSPLGVAYIAANLEKNNFEVSILDCLVEGWETRKIEKGNMIIGLSEEEIKKRIINEKPDICGVSVPFSSQKDQPHKLARIIKQVSPKIKVIFGGPHPSGNSEEVMKDKNVDFVIKGEGEVAMVKLLNNLKTPKKVPGIVYRKNNQILFSGPPQFIENLDELPFPAYHLLNMDKYFEYSSDGYSVRRHVAKSKRWASIFTSRGCPFNCVFCSIHNTMGYKFRPRSPKNVLDEIELLYDKYGVRTFFFEDDNFSMDKDRAKEILRGILTRKLEINWQAPNGLRADLLDDELISLMKDTNCTRVRIAIEHGDQKFLEEVIGKRLNLKVLKEAVKKIRKKGLDVDGFFVLGIPGETKETMRKSVNFAKELSAIGLNPLLAMAIPLPGTRMYKICEENNFLVKKNFTSKDYQLASSKEPLISTPTMSASELKKWYFKAFRETFMIRFMNDPKVLLNINLVQDFKNRPFQALKITYSYIKSALLK
ncbi:MAG: radical SAM protein [Nanoarchaeota archaeon]|nr:B12-binding domain-containing radical SAM protein [Nanoarchaeota archaeon]MBU1445598.1 B12-binding domain-containing radical SAM protein [Nanoarchaeota archaeon]MBU2420909.1 B12-binding domain-containing radical SAM protein [Nanoarchaeota archaeon]MBU2475290.1 B12-binding domain-containing radical SAM protein [Nanoarchaeota archaeon]